MTEAIAEALYVGLVTDTGRFMYENTGPRAHEMAAELIAGGVDAHAIYRRLYEGIPQGKLELLARGLSNVERFDGGLLTLTHLTRDDYLLSGADESYSEGVVDHLRSVEGTAVAGLVREQLAEGASARKVSLRATDDRIDVSGSRARAAAAGTAGRPASPPISSSRARRVPAQQLPINSARVAARWDARPPRVDGVLLVDKPAGVTSHDVVAARAAAARSAA